MPKFQFEQHCIKTSPQDQFAMFGLIGSCEFPQGALKVLGKSVGLCKTTKRNDQLYISLLVSVWRIICENFNPNGLILAEI